jgi:hypothetical protein
MKAAESDVRVALQRTRWTDFSRLFRVFAALALILLAVAPVQALAARSWDIGTDIYYENATKTIELTTDPEAYVVELPAGQSEFRQAFALEVPSQETVDQLREKAKESDEYKANPAAFIWILDNTNALMHFETVVEVSAEGGNRIFEVIIEAGTYNAGILSFEGPEKMYIQVAPKSFRDISVPGNNFDWFVNEYSARAYQPTKIGLLLEFRIHTFGSINPALFVTLREVPLACWMQVEYWGDFQGSDSGDLAYYNDFLDPDNRYAEQGGVGRATGNAVDPTAQATLSYLMEMTGAYSGGHGAIFPEEEAAGTGTAFDPFSDTTFPELEEVVNRQKMEDFYNWLGEKTEGEELETWGITMAGTSVNQVTESMTNEELADIRMKGLGQMITASVLEAASSSPTVKAIFDPATGRATGASIPLSRLDFKPMVMAGTFRWADGKPGFGKLKVTPLSAGVLGGEIYGTLYSHEVRRDDGSDSEISIHARFIAAEGAFGCHMPGLDKILK